MPTITTPPAPGERRTRIRQARPRASYASPVPRYPPNVRIVDGRTLISRAEQSARTGLSVRRLYALYGQRKTTGHPEPVDHKGSTSYWDEAEWHSWHRRYEAKKRASFTEVDRSGDPDELVPAAEADRMLGYRQGTVQSYLRDNANRFPEPDKEVPMPSGKDGKKRKMWRRSTIWRFADGRDGRGGGRPQGTGTGPRGPRYQNHPYMNQARLALATDPNPNAAEFARRHGLKEHTARRLLAAAKQEQATTRPPHQDPRPQEETPDT